LYTPSREQREARGSRGGRDGDDRKNKGRRTFRKINKFAYKITETIDFKNIGLMQKFLTDRGKIMSRRVTGISAKQQRQMSMAIKRARYLGLLPIMGRNS